MALDTVPDPTLAVELSKMPRHSCGVVVEHGTDAGTAERLSALGLCLGALFRVVRAGKRMVVQVGESRIGLGPDLSCVVRAIAR